MQAYLRLYWSYIPHCWKSHVPSHLYNFFFSKFGCTSVPEDFLSLQTMLSIMRNFIWVFTVCQSNHLGVSPYTKVTVHSSKIFLLNVPRRYFFCGSFVLLRSCVCHAFTSVHCCLVVTCLERADLLALVCYV